MSEVDDLVNKIKLTEGAISIKKTIMDDLIIPVQKAGFDEEETRTYVASILMEAGYTYLLPFALLEVSRAYEKPRKGKKDGTATIKSS